MSLLTLNKHRKSTLKASMNEGVEFKELNDLPLSELSLFANN